MIVESEVIDQSESIIGEDVGRVGLGIDGLTAGVPAEVREDDAVARLGEDGGGAVIKPLPTAAGEAVEQYQRTAFPDLAVGQFQAVPAVEVVPAHVGGIGPRVVGQDAMSLRQVRWKKPSSRPRDRTPDAAARTLRGGAEAIAEIFDPSATGAAKAKIWNT